MILEPLKISIEDVPTFNKEYKRSLFSLPRLFMSKERTKMGVGYANEMDCSSDGKWDIINFNISHYFKVLIAKHNNGTLRNPDSFWDTYIAPYQISKHTPSVKRDKLKLGDVCLLWPSNNLAIVTESEPPYSNITAMCSFKRLSTSYNHTYLHWNKGC